MSIDAVAAMAFDPATAVLIGKWSDHSPRLAEIELHEDDFEKFRQLAASGRRAARLGHELRAVCVGDAGVWGAILMRRERGAPNFTTRDVDLLASLSGGHAEVQRARLEQHVSADADDRDPGQLLLDDEGGVEMANAGAAAWLDDLPDHGRRLPLVVTAVAQRARHRLWAQRRRGDGAGAERVRSVGARVRFSALQRDSCPHGGHAGAGASSRARRDRCERLRPHCARAARDGARRARPAHRRARRPGSPVDLHDPDHLKAIFEKLGVSSRGELVARLFLDRPRVGGRSAVSACARTQARLA